MSILNQSINPSRQQILPDSKGSNTHDLSQHRPMALPLLQGSHTLKSLSKALPTVAVGETSHVVSMNGIANLSQVLLGTIFPHSVITEGENLDLMEEDGLGALEHSSRSSYALAVSVTSATKLDSKQIDLISRKMQRLTGFRSLRLENIIDPSVIAGFVISYGSDDSHVIDLSVKGQLAALAARVESSDQRIASHGQNWSFPSAKRS